MRRCAPGNPAALLRGREGNHDRSVAPEGPARASAATLAAGASVTQAALDCGYDSPSTYIAAFHKQFGVTPGRFARSAVRDDEPS
jgi:AraC-like DNA-binding protein